MHQIDRDACEPSLVLDVIGAASNAKCQAGEVVEGLRLAQLAVDASGGDPTRPSAILRVPALSHWRFVD